MATGCLMELIDGLEDCSVEEKEELVELQRELIEEYERLSVKYHREKGDNVDNSLVLG